jgi:hypothetical protein
MGAGELGIVKVGRPPALPFQFPNTVPHFSGNNHSGVGVSPLQEELQLRLGTSCCLLCVTIVLISPLHLASVTLIVVWLQGVWGLCRGDSTVRSKGHRSSSVTVRLLLLKVPGSLSILEVLPSLEQHKKNKNNVEFFP